MLFSGPGSYPASNFFSRLVYYVVRLRSKRFRSSLVLGFPHLSCPKNALCIMNDSCTKPCSHKSVIRHSSMDMLPLSGCPYSFIPIFILNLLIKSLKLYEGIILVVCWNDVCSGFHRAACIISTVSM